MRTSAHIARACLAACALGLAAAPARAEGGAPMPAPMPAPKPAAVSAAEAARAALIERLKGAAEAGIIAFPDPAARSGAPAADAPAPAGPDRTAAAAAVPAGTQGETQTVPEAGEVARPAPPACHADAAIAAALTPPDGPLPPLAGEFDRIDAEAVDAHVRAALGHAMGTEALFLLRAFPEAQPPQAALYRDLAGVIDGRAGLAETALARAQGCTGLHALMQAAAHAHAGDTAASAAAAMRAGDAADALPLPVRTAVGPHIVTAALDAGDAALAGPLARALLSDAPETDGWVRLARARLDAATRPGTAATAPSAGEPPAAREAREALLALAEGQHPAAIPAALAAAALTAPDDADADRVAVALDRVLHLMRHRPEGAAAAGLRVHRLIAGGRAAEALDILARVPRGDGTDLLRLAALDAIAAVETLPAGERAVLLYTHLAALPDTVTGIEDTLTHAAWLFAGLSLPAVAAELDARRARLAGDAPVLTAEETPAPAHADADALGRTIDARTQAAGDAVAGAGLPGRVRTALARARATETAILEVQRP